MVHGLALWLAASAWAGKRTVEVPVDIGVGPAVLSMTGPVAQQQPWHTGLAISAEAVLDNKTLRKFRKRIPRQYRDMVLDMDEVRISHPLIPRTLIISPAGMQSDTGIYGIGWRPVGLDVDWLDGPGRVRTGIGARVTYFYLHSGTLPAPMHFLRPGLDATGEIEIPFSERFLVSAGWVSMFHIPQPVGGGVFESAPLQDSVWHIGQGFFKLHFRVPVEVKR